MKKTIQPTTFCCYSCLSFKRDSVQSNMSNSHFQAAWCLQKQAGDSSCLFQPFQEEWKLNHIKIEHGDHSLHPQCTYNGALVTGEEEGECPLCVSSHRQLQQECLKTTDVIISRSVTAVFRRESTTGQGVEPKVSFWNQPNYWRQQ